MVEAVLATCGSSLGVGADLEWGRLDGPGLRTAAAELGRVISAVQHQQRRVLGLIDERRAFAADGSRDAADWAAGRLGMSRHAAVRELDTGRRLEALPELADRAGRGELSAEQAAPAVRLAEAEPDGAGSATWAGAAPGMGVDALRRRAGRARRPAAADHAAARAARGFEAWVAGQELRYRGSVPVDDGARLMRAIERSMPERDGVSTLGQRQADGLLALAGATIAADGDPDRATVVAVVELAAICDDDPSATAELEAGEPLATETARRLVCDSRLSVLVQDRAGRAVGLSSTARTVPPALRRALVQRDGGCRFGSCTATRFLHAHHVVHWPAPTSMSNLAMVCYQHHHALHEGGWTLTGDPSGELVAIHPDGRRSDPSRPQHAEPSGGCAGPPAGVGRPDPGGGPDPRLGGRPPVDAAAPATLFADTG